MFIVPLNTYNQQRELCLENFKSLFLTQITVLSNAECIVSYIANLCIDAKTFQLEMRLNELESIVCYTIKRGKLFHIY